MPPSRCSTVLRWLSASSTPWVTTALSSRANIDQPPKVAQSEATTASATRKGAR